MNFTTARELLDYCDKEKKKISEAMFIRETTDLEQSPEETSKKMQRAYEIMKQSIERALTEEIYGMGGMIGGESRLLNTLREDGKNLCGPLVSKAIAYAMGVLEVNASMGLIVESAGTYHNVIRFLAPLVITDEQLKAGLDIFEKAVEMSI